jgi:uncharacterized protein YndB with AHSA1/START domain
MKSTRRPSTLQGRRVTIAAALSLFSVGSAPVEIAAENQEAVKMTAENTVRLHRVLAAKPEKVYRAFLDPAAVAKWFPPEGFTCTVYAFDAKVGGEFKMSFTNFTTGEKHFFGGGFRALTPGQYIQYTERFEDPNLAGEILVTVTLKEVSCGTEMTITQENLPEIIPLEGCYIGWQQSLQFLAKLVEPDIK